MRLKGTSNLNFNKTNVLYLVDDCGTVVTAEVIRSYPLTVKLIFEERFIDPVESGPDEFDFKYYYIQIGKFLYKCTRYSKLIKEQNKIINLPEEEVLIYRTRDWALSSCVKLLINKNRLYYVDWRKKRK